MSIQRTLELIENKLQFIKTLDSKLCLVGPIQLPLSIDGNVHVFQWYTWIDCEGLPTDKEKFLNILPDINMARNQHSSVILYGDFQHSNEALVRIHSICHTGDIFGSERCDCSYQLKSSLRLIAEAKSGALFYNADQEGRGIGLLGKSLTYIIQENGYDTVQANQMLGYEVDQRDYDEVSVVLNHLRYKPISLITNNPLKVKALRSNGIKISDLVPLWGGESKYNTQYINTKIHKCEHVF